MTFPEQVHLPFNFSIIKESFQLSCHSQQEPAEDGYWAIMQGNGVLLTRDENGLALPRGGLPDWLRPKAPPLFIGQWRGKPLRAFGVGSDLPLQAPFEAEAFNAAEQRLDMPTLTVSGLAKQILHWERQGRHCSRCGAPTEPMAGSWGKRCTGCAAEHFPHIHPCAIVLVRKGDELLLTRKAEWPVGRYSLVAGFVDFGESLEECAIREVREETGIGIENVRYVGSQNWPFPSQLMAGFVADFADGEITVDTNELEDARWFPLNALPSLPPKRSIARWIIDNFKSPASCSI
ncbi:MAG: NAD(+) diphosphatase [Oryzomonas sp.]|uniref:NAD(+) diphosphatase n=1 Tax=Oryzomonas sp. TaxID=2855186 RepID=UPI0028513B8F|nr:NAD(+) diphosphatase [Oryzomonas sp.]MDR3580038.1 NAD(+) diphosphatase [Oryzomonas sp.]